MADELGKITRNRAINRSYLESLKTQEGAYRKVKVAAEVAELEGIRKQWSSPEYAQYFRQIIIHFHGGGFVAMSSSSHLTYLIKWANALCPVFSVDYRLAPFVQYPELLDDVMRSYLWILVRLRHGL